MPVQTHSNGLTTDELRTIPDSEPLEVSLFIGGREFPLKGISLKEGSKTFKDALEEERHKLEQEMIFDVDKLSDQLEMPADEVRIFLAERELYLVRLISQLA